MKRPNDMTPAERRHYHLETAEECRARLNRVRHSGITAGEQLRAAQLSKSRHRDDAPLEPTEGWLR